MIKPNAGKMRGVIAFRDPDGILLDSFSDEYGNQYGYVIVYGQGSPAVFDGETWHPITDETEEEWEASLQDKIVEQGIAIAKAAQTSPAYAEIAKMVGIFVGAGVGAPSDNVFTFGPNS